MNTHNKTGATKNQQQHIHNQTELLAADDQTETQHVYALQVIDDQSQMDGDSPNEGDITEYLTHANIITKDDDDDDDVEDEADGTASENEGQLLQIYDVESDPIELLTFEDDELEWNS